MHMKKAVTLIKGFLKLPKLRKNDVSNQDTKENREAKSQLPKHSIFRPCKRCVLVYETTLWIALERKLLLQKHNEQNNDSLQEIQRRTTGHESEANVTEDDRVCALFQFHGLVKPNLRELSVCSNKSCMSTTCLRGHTFRLSEDVNDDLLGPHYPTFIMVAKSKEKWPVPLLYEDADLVLFKAGLSLVRSIVNFSLLAPELTLALNAEVWVLVSKLRHHTVSLSVEEDLVFEYLDYFVWLAFLDVPSSRLKRASHLEALYQAVDHIMDISLYITLTSGIPPENQSVIKDAIIETATVVTSTAAESTATVGIETAAMAMGQAAAGVALSVLVDVGITAGMVTRAKIRRDKGLISQKEFQKTVRYKLCDSSCQFIGGTAGTIVGQVLIPVPVVGAIVGGFCGSLLGAGVSKGIIKTSEIISKTQASRFKAITEK